MIEQAFLETEKGYVLATRNTEQLITVAQENPVLIFDTYLAVRGFTPQADGMILLKANTSYLLRSQFIIQKGTSALRTELGLYNVNTQEFMPNSIYPVDGALDVYEYPVKFNVDTMVQLRFSVRNSDSTMLPGISFIEVKEV